MSTQNRISYVLNKKASMNKEAAGGLEMLMMLLAGGGLMFFLPKLIEMFRGSNLAPSSPAATQKQTGTSGRGPVNGTRNTGTPGSATNSDEEVENAYQRGRIDAVVPAKKVEIKNEQTKSAPGTPSTPAAPVGTPSNPATPVVPAATTAKPEVPGKGAENVDYSSAGIEQETTDAMTAADQQEAKQKAANGEFHYLTPEQKAYYREHPEELARLQNGQGTLWEPPQTEAQQTNQTQGVDTGDSNTPINAQQAIAEQETPISISPNDKRFETDVYNVKTYDDASKLYKKYTDIYNNPNSTPEQVAFADEAMRRLELSMESLNDAKDTRESNINNFSKRLTGAQARRILEGDFDLPFTPDDGFKPTMLEMQDAANRRLKEIENTKREMADAQRKGTGGYTYEQLAEQKNQQTAKNERIDHPEDTTNNGSLYRIGRTALNYWGPKIKSGMEQRGNAQYEQAKAQRDADAAVGQAIKGGVKTVGNTVVNTVKAVPAALNAFDEAAKDVKYNLFPTLNHDSNQYRKDQAELASLKYDPMKTLKQTQKKLQQPGQQQPTNQYTLKKQTQQPTPTFK